jgi:hypothetical protein
MVGDDNWKKKQNLWESSSVSGGSNAKAESQNFWSILLAISPLSLDPTFSGNTTTASVSLFHTLSTECWLQYTSQYSCEMPVEGHKNIRPNALGMKTIHQICMLDLKCKKEFRRMYSLLLQPHVWAATHQHMPLCTHLQNNQPSSQRPHVSSYNHT